MHPSLNGQSAGHDSVFGGVLRALQKRMRREQYETWFHGFRLHRFDDESVEFTVPSVFVREWLLRNYKADIEAAVEVTIGPDRDVRVALDAQEQEAALPRGVAGVDMGSGVSATAIAAETTVDRGEELPAAAGDSVLRSVHAAESSRSRPLGDDGFDGDPSPGGVPVLTDTATVSTEAGSAEAMDDGEFLDSGPSASEGREPLAREPLTLTDTGVPHPSRGKRDQYLTKLNKDYILDQFVVGPCNRLAHAAGVAIGENPGRAYNPLFIHGNVGLGKTHLLQATCHEILRKQRSARVLYLSCEDFTNRFVQSVRANTVDEFRDLHRSVDILVIDDVQFLANKGKTQDEFFHTFNALYNAKRQIVISSDRPPVEIPTIEERLVSRFKWGLVTEMEKPCFDTRVTIVRRKARVRGIEFSDDVAHFIADKVDSNIRELEGAVVKVIGIAALVEREIDVALVKDALQGVCKHQHRSQVGLPDIMQLITREFSVSAKDICGKRRTQKVSLPRQIGMFLSRERTEHSLEEIGRFFGNRDHTTVLYAVSKIKTRSRDDRMFRDLLKSLDEQLSA